MQSDSSDSAMTQAGFVYEKTTGLYYHSDSGYYYDTKSGLYYNGNTGTYYYYDKENGVYKFHSQVQSEAVQGNQQIVPNITEKGKKRRKKKKERLKKIKLMEGEEDLVKEIVEVENADCKDSQSNIKEDSSISCSSSDSESKIDEDIAEDYPPCMRIIVKETSLSNLKIGSLFIVAYTGGSIGREGDHLVIIPDINISKHHAKLQYNEEKKVYELIDLGSRNGTFLNGKRLSAAKQESEPSEIVHGSILQLGFTKLLCHVHSGYKTCGHCEPGLVQTDSTTEDNNFSLKSLHKSELKRLKNKYGINNDNTKSASRVASGYHDRAQSRREYIGSSSHHTKTQQSDIHQSISKDNTGFKMLEKMGWKEGESLGKSGVGLTEPLMVTPVINKAGLGSSDQNVQIDPSVEKKQAIWRKTQIRFNEIDD